MSNDTNTNAGTSKGTGTTIADLVEDLQPVRPLTMRKGICLALGVMALGVVLAITLGTMRADLASGRPSGVFMVSNGLFLILGLACAAAVLLMGTPRVGNARGGWGWALAMAGLLPLSALILAFANGHAAWEASEPVHGLDCLAASVGLGLMTGGVLVLWLRRGAPTSPEQAGFLTGIAAGASGVFAFSFACSIDAIVHVGLWHGLAVILSALAGRLIVPPLVRW